MSPSWAAEDLIVEGRYASKNDRVETFSRLCSVAGAPCGILTYSTAYILPSLSAICLGDETRESQLLKTVADSYKVLVESADDSAGLVSDLISDYDSSLASVAVTPPPGLMGQLGVSVFCREQVVQELTDSELCRRIAVVVLGSQVESSHSANATDAVIRGEIDRHPITNIPPGTASTSHLAQLRKGVIDHRRSEVVRLLEENISGTAICAYVRSGSRLVANQSDSNDGFPTAIEIGANSNEASPWTWLTETTAWSGEIDAQVFGSDESLVRKAQSRGQRLLGIVDGALAIAAPFGGVPGRRRTAAGVLIARRLNVRRLEPFTRYEIASLRAVETRLARIASGERWFANMEQMLQHVQQLTDKVAAASNAAPQGCVEPLRGRRDVGLVSTLVESILDDLLITTGASSATCRLVVGIGPSLGQRQLARLAAAGTEERDAGPSLIPIVGPQSESVNSWVAFHGLPCYLRDIPDDRSTGELQDAALVWSSTYPGLHGIIDARKTTRSELCVPIESEGRVVGTMNLESSVPYGFDESAYAVEEYAQMIGLAVRLARREISIDMLHSAEGFLDRRHELAGCLDAASKHLEDARSDDPSGAINGIERALDAARVYINDVFRPNEDDDLPEHLVQVHHILAKELGAVSLSKGIGLSVWDVGAPAGSLPAIMASYIDSRRAGALGFALRQVLTNAAKYRLKGGTFGHRTPAGWSNDIDLQVQMITLGDTPNLVVGVRNACFRDELNDSYVKKMYREPLAKNSTGRVALGAFLAGEALRRVGGAASFHVDEYNDSTYIVSSELSVPISNSSEG